MHDSGLVESYWKEEGNFLVFIVLWQRRDDKKVRIKGDFFRILE